jgi:hypothetical protein
VSVHSARGFFCRTMLALGTVAVKPERAENGSVHIIWLDPGVLAKLKALRCLPIKPRG